MPSGTDRPGCAAIVLAAGRGKRFPGVPSKVLVELAGRPLVARVVAALEHVAGCRIVVVVGHGRAEVRAALAGRPVEFAEQDRPLGTGHAVLAARALLAGHAGPILVVNGDVPLIRPATLARLLAAVGPGRAAAAVLTAVVDEPGAYGRIVRGPQGDLLAIVEAADADPATLAGREINAGAYAFGGSELFAVLAALTPDNAQGEIYLTDAVRALVARGERVAAVPVADPVEAAGVNTPEELAALAARSVQ